MGPWRRLEWNHPSGHFETQTCPFRPNLCSNDGNSDGHSLNDHKSGFIRQTRPYGRRRFADEPLRFGSEANTETERGPVERGSPCTRLQPTSGQLLPPKLMTTGPLSPAQSLSINQSSHRIQLPSEVLYWHVSNMSMHRSTFQG